MRLVVTGGGTGGHLYPALCVAEWAQRQGDTVLYLGSQHGLEGQMRLPLPAQLLDMAGLRHWRRHPLRMVRSLLRARREAYAALEAFQAEVVFGTGGYVAAPILLAQKRRRRPFVLLEPDALPGLTNRWLARSATAVCVAFEEAKPFFRYVFPGRAPTASIPTDRPGEGEQAGGASARIFHTGLPVRPEVVGSPLTPQEARARFELKLEPFTILVLGGSQGAQTLNETVLNTVQHLSSDGLQWLHLTGMAHLETVRATADRLALNGNYRALAFLEGAEMGHAYRAADMVIARAGSSTVAEIALNGLPAVFIPYPFAARAHQQDNGMALVSRSAAVMILQKELTPARLSELILRWRDCPEERLRIGANARAWAIPDATQRIYELLVRCKGS